MKPGPIGIFDSGYGGLTVLAEIKKLLPEYDYIYLGDNLRAPYGSRSFEVVYDFTKQAVEKLFGMGCNLVILACNTASAKALRTIQQKDLPLIAPEKRVLGVIRPTVEVVNRLTKNGHIGILGTIGTIQSQSYNLEIKKFFPEYTVTGQACPMWAPLVENNEYDNEGTDFFIRKYTDEILKKDPLIDTIILGCTHYPILEKKIKESLPANVSVISQGSYVAESLKDYLSRHPEMEKACTKNSTRRYFTTESAKKFVESATIFLKENIEAKKITL